MRAMAGLTSRKRPSYPVSPSDSPDRGRPRVAVPAPALVPCEGLGNKRQLKLRDEDKLIDITLKVAGTEIRAHKLLLASCSPYLEGLLAGNFVEAEQDVVALPELNGAAVAAVIDACYTGNQTLHKCIILI